MDLYLLANPMSVSAGIEFMLRYTSSNGTVKALGIDYGLQVNATVKNVRGIFEDQNYFIQQPLQNAAERAIAKYLYTNQTGLPATGLQWQLSTSDFAHPSLNPFSYVGAISPTFLLAAAMFTFVLQMTNVVLERELKLRSAMRVMGLYDTVFWVSWLAWEVIVMNFISTIFIVCFGMAFQFDLFLNNSFGVLFFHFWLFELAMTGLAFWLSTFLAKANSGTFVGFIIFLFGFILMLVVNQGNVPFSSDYSGPDYAWLQYLFAMFPPTLLAKGINDLGAATATPQLAGISWAQRKSYCTNNTYNAAGTCVWSLSDIYNWFILDFFAFIILTFYCDKIFPNEYGVSLPWYFLLQPSYWTGGAGATTATSVDEVEAAGVIAGSVLNEGLDSDVAAEEEAIKARLRSGQVELEPGVAVEVRGIVKSFNFKSAACGCCKCCAATQTYHAVRGNWFRIETGKLFALLGPNGAGKTTTINCLTGLLPISAGNGIVYGNSVVGGISAIRGFMGVCPQFDMLWGELTAREHLRIFSAIKGMPRTRWNAVTTELLEETKLTPAADRRSSGFSGGMKRRLSVAVALIGDPAIVYLDEPTTGMDPITRRYVWDIVLAAKPGRAIVLTTHSMEEADVLADNIAIIAKGRLRCLGSALRLKNKFGAGYRIAVSVVPTTSASSAALAGITDQALEQRRAALKRFFQDNLGVPPSEEGRMYTTFMVPRSLEGRLGQFLDVLRQNRDRMGITDVQMGLTTLEEVFLTIATNAERAAAAAEGKSATLLVTMDGVQQQVMVPWGETELVLPIGNASETLSVTWVQDDEGRLVYAHHTFRGVKESNMVGQLKPVKTCGCF